MAYTVDRVADLDREEIRRSVLDRFSAERMTDGYEAVYRTMLAGDSAAARREELARGDSVIPPERLATRRTDRIGGGVVSRR